MTAATEVSHQEVELGVGSHLENVTVPGVLAAMRMANSKRWPGPIPPPPLLFFFAVRQGKLPVIKRHPADFRLPLSSVTVCLGE